MDFSKAFIPSFLIPIASTPILPLSAFNSIGKPWQSHPNLKSTLVPDIILLRLMMSFKICEVVYVFKKNIN